MVRSKSSSELSIVTDDVDIKMDVIMNMSISDGPVEIERSPQRESFEPSWPQPCWREVSSWGEVLFDITHQFISSIHRFDHYSSQ